MANRVQRISITLSIIFRFLINCVPPQCNNVESTTRFTLLTLLHAINHASHEELREPVATKPRRSIFLKNLHSFAPFTPRRLRIREISTITLSIFQRSKPNCKVNRFLLEEFIQRLDLKSNRRENSSIELILPSAIRVFETVNWIHNVVVGTWSNEKTSFVRKSSTLPLATVIPVSLYAPLNTTR